MVKKEKLSDILSPTTLSKISNYNLLAKVAVEGFISGLHRSVSHGFGSEFMQYRNYSPGDELKYVDWKVYGRSNRYYTKVFHEETNMSCNIILDSSASMAYKGSRAVCSKFHYGAILAATLAYLASRQGDMAGLFCYNEQCVSHFHPSSSNGHIQRLIASLSTVEPKGVGKHEKYLQYLAGSIRKKGMVIIISDFMDHETDYSALLKSLGFSNHECIVLQVLDRDELDLPFTNTSRFHDSETGEEIITASSAIRDDYIQKVNAYTEKFRQSCLRNGIDYLSVDTGDEIGKVLAAYLNHREGGKC